MATKQLKPHKATGPDGFPAQHFKVFWNSLRDPFLAAFNSVCCAQRVTVDTLWASIFLIPKDGKGYLGSVQTTVQFHSSTWISRSLLKF